MTELITYSGKVIGPHKAVNSAVFGQQTVLTNDPFVYVDLWLRREHQDDALFFWRQAGHFYRSATGLPIEAKPLVLYYTFMNAAKALLSSKSIIYSPIHGVKHHNMRAENSKIVLSNEGVKIREAGVVPALSSYFAEAEVSTEHSLESMLYNLVHIHRTFSLTYPHWKDIFAPLRNTRFVRDPVTGSTTFACELVSDVSWASYRRILPPNFTATRSVDGITINSTANVALTSSNALTGNDLQNLSQLNSAVRASVKYIRGSSTLWYLKMKSTRQIQRHQLTLTIAAMHRLSELSRYKPRELSSLLNGQKNWLLTEFIEMSPGQFIDQGGAEITGQQIMVPNVRDPK
ncbi:MAG: YaaC family protein [Sphingomicrobium sp.]